MKIECPACKGSGYVDIPAAIKQDAIKVKAGIAKELKRKGYTVREIMLVMGYKSTSAIQFLLNKKLK